MRDWIHVEDHCRGMLAALEQGRAGRVYNLGGDAERTNLQEVRRILELLGHGEELIRFVKDRAGHDRRCAIDSTRAQAELRWAPRTSFEGGLEQTVAWYRPRVVAKSEERGVQPVLRGPIPRADADGRQSYALRTLVAVKDSAGKFTS